MEISGLILTWTISDWRPHLPVSSGGIGSLLAFGVHRTAADFISSLARGSDNLLIGRAYGANAVGLYSRASVLLIRPLEQFLSPINAVFVPALSRLQSDAVRYRSTFLRLYEVIALLGFVFTALLLALARPLTLVLLGPKWLDAAAIFGGFTIAALCVPLANASIWLFISQGRGKDGLVAQSINACAIVASFLIGLPYGPVGVAMSFSICGVLIRIPVLYYIAGRQGPVRAMDLWGVLLRHLPVWIIVFFTTWTVLMLVKSFPPVFQLMISVPAGGASAILFTCMFKAQRKVVAQLFRIIRELKGQ